MWATGKLSLLVLLSFVTTVGVKTFAQQPAKKITAKVIALENKTFGYDIYQDGKLAIHQPTIPGKSGTKGFETKKDRENIFRPFWYTHV